MSGFPLQSVDMRYTIRGWLKSINNAALNVNSANNDELGDYFGLELLYNTSEAGLNDQPGEVYHNGNVSAAKWNLISTGLSTEAANGKVAYRYKYDKSDKLKEAKYLAQDNGSAWTKRVDVYNETMSYDHNGNITALVRNQNNRGLTIGTTNVTVSSSPQQVDNLTYSYTTNTNQLLKVEDAVANTVGANDFKNVNSAIEYTYNADGSLNKDLNKDINTISYNALGKPSVVTYNGTPTKTVTYIYDAAGAKIKAVTVANGVTTTTDYVGGFVYTNNALSFFSSPEGRVVKNGANYEYQYAIADHQGNTRVMFTSATPVKQQITATFENAGEVGQFQNYPATSGINIIATNNTTAGGSRSQHLNAGYMGMVGVSQSYHVYPGDSVKISAKARYDAPLTSNSSLTNFAGALLGAFMLPTPTPGEVGTRSAAINGWGLTAAGGFANGTGNDGYINAYVNIIIFDKNYKLLEFKAAPVTSAGAPALLSAGYLVKEEGYAFLYISNEQPVQTSVYFDDVAFMYKPTNILQYNEYYPFGLQTANSWTRENTTGNNYLANGGTELNTTTSVYDLHYRNYDPQLGRMNQVDPMASKYASQTPYNYAFNAPTNLNDPLGDDPFFNRDAWRGNMRGGASYPRGERNGMDDANWGNSGSLSAGAFAAADDFFTGARQTHGIMEALKEMFKDATFGKGGSNGFYIRILGTDYSTEDLTAGLEVNGLATLSIRDVYVSNITRNHFRTMTNPLVQAIHQGQRDFVNNPWGGALIGFLSTAPLGGTGALFGRLLSGGRALMPVVTRGVNTFGQLSGRGLNVVGRNLVQTGFRSASINATAQFVFKGFDYRNIDLADVAISAASGDAWVTSGILGGLLDVNSKGIQTAYDKGIYQTSIDIGLGTLFGGANFAGSRYLGSVGIGGGLGVGVDFTVQSYGELFNYVLSNPR